MNYIIVGTDHRLQKSDANDIGLRDLLQSIVDTHSVVLIAEEAPTSKEVRTFERDLIGDEKWLPVDMDETKRKEKGLDDIPCEQGPGYDPITHSDIIVNRYHTRREGIREDFWLGTIAQWCAAHELSAGTIVLVCGHNHMRAGYLFGKVLQRGHTVSTREYMPFDVDATLGRFDICP